MQDAIVKGLSGGYPVHQLLFIRCLVSLPLMVAFIAYDAGFGSLLPPSLGRVVVRGLVLATAYLAFVLAIAALPIADVVSVYFTMPFFVAGLAGPLLGERVPLYRWLAIVAGFIGVLIMIRPGSGVLEPAALLALYSAFGYAVGQMMGRPLSQRVRPVVQAFWQNIVYLAVALVLAAIFREVGADQGLHKSLDFLARPWIVPAAGDWPVLIAMGVLGAVSMPMFSSAYKYADANFVAPFEYTAMIWAVTFGFIFWGDIPGWSTAAGGGVVVTAGLYMLWQDGRRRR